MTKAGPPAPGPGPARTQVDAGPGPGVPAGPDRSRLGSHASGPAAAWPGMARQSESVPRIRVPGPVRRPGIAAAGSPPARWGRRWSESPRPPPGGPRVTVTVARSRRGRSVAACHGVTSQCPWHRDAAAGVTIPSPGRSTGRQRLPGRGRRPAGAAAASHGGRRPGGNLNCRHRVTWPPRPGTMTASDSEPRRVRPGAVTVTTRRRRPTAGGPGGRRH